MLPNLDYQIRPFISRSDQVITLEISNSHAPPKSLDRSRSELELSSISLSAF